MITIHEDPYVEITIALVSCALTLAHERSDRCLPVIVHDALETWICPDYSVRIIGLLPPRRDWLHKAVEISQRWVFMRIESHVLAERSKYRRANLAKSPDLRRPTLLDTRARVPN